MDFKDQIKQIAERVGKMKDSLQTEEATKNALIMPFLQSLGYDVFNPGEVVPEYTCDIGIKKGEKIDYAILKDNQPIILIECKHVSQDLNLHDNQLLRYFNVSKAYFGVLTNGVVYKFYTDLEKENIMDEKPFLEINMIDLKDNQIDELKKFHKSYFDIETILSSASELKYMNELKNVLIREFSNPSNEFVKILAKQVYDGQFTAKILEQFTSLVKRSISLHINDVFSERLKTALKSETEESRQETEVDRPQTEEQKNDEIVTTEDELEAFYIVKSILRPSIACERITYRDSKSYFAVFVDDNNRKTICRLYLNTPSNKRIVFLDENKKEVVYKIQSLDDIYLYSSQLIDVSKKYL